MRYVYVALCAGLLTMGGLRLLGWAPPMPEKVTLDNKRVRVKEVTYAPGQPRERYTRPTDQVIVFLDESKYERIDSATKAKSIRQRKSGEVIWHDKGEDAPALTNLGAEPYQPLVIEIQ